MLEEGKTYIAYGVGYHTGSYGNYTAFADASVGSPLGKAEIATIPSGSYAQEIFAGAELLHVEDGKLLTRTGGSWRGGDRGGATYVPAPAPQPRRQYPAALDTHRPRRGRAIGHRTIVSLDDRGRAIVTTGDNPETALTYSIYRNNIYTLGDKNSDQIYGEDEPLDLSAGSVLVMDVNPEWEALEAIIFN